MFNFNKENSSGSGGVSGRTGRRNRRQAKKDDSSVSRSPPKKRGGKKKESFKSPSPKPQTHDDDNFDPKLPGKFIKENLDSYKFVPDSDMKMTVEGLMEECSEHLQSGVVPLRERVKNKHVEKPNPDHTIDE